MSEIPTLKNLCQQRFIEQFNMLPVTIKNELIELQKKEVNNRLKKYIVKNYTKKLCDKVEILVNNDLSKLFCDPSLYSEMYSISGDKDEEYTDIMAHEISDKIYKVISNNIVTHIYYNNSKDNNSSDEYESDSDYY